jgi:uncharacterized iron-regulated membrane protein
MAKTTKKRLRATWLQVHKWIGLTLAILIIPISLTGSALVWKGWLDQQLQPQRYASLGPASHAPSVYANAVKSGLGVEERLSELRYQKGGKPLIAVVTKPSEGRPSRTQVWIDPRDASIIDRAPGNSGTIQVMHNLHGSLMVPGWGRTIVGWVGAFMFVSCLTGIWLWWPLSGGFRSGLRWKRRNTTNANLHYLTGFWILFPLAMLSFTGAWISFPKLFGKFENRPAATSDRERAARAQPLATPKLGVDAAASAAAPYARGPLTSIVWPTDQASKWKIGFDAKGGPAAVPVDDDTARASAPPPPPPETLARTMRRWHDGTGMGAVWQTVIFLGGIIPALLSITGIIIWWRARTPRSRARRNQLARA